MTTPKAAIPAGLAVAVLLLAMAARPFLPTRHEPPAPASDEVGQPSLQGQQPWHPVTRAARGALACPTPAAAGRTHRPVTPACGDLHIERRQITCARRTRCVAQLIGTLHTATVSVPVALVVTVENTGTGWRTVKVVS
jgi:hypothetical protein